MKFAVEKSYDVPDRFLSIHHSDALNIVDAKCVSVGVPPTYLMFPGSAEDSRSLSKFLRSYLEMKTSGYLNNTPDASLREFYEFHFGSESEDRGYGLC